MSQDNNTEKAMFRLDGHVALITGAATGLGAGIAEALARQGAAVAVSDKPGVSLDATQRAAEAYGGRVFAFAMDVRDLDQQTEGVAAVSAALGAVDILVNNAGINRPAPGLEALPAEWDDHYATNVRGGFFLAQKLAPGMIERHWGRIIWLASQSGLRAIPGQPIYCSSKGAVIQAVRTLGVEWAPHGVTVNAIAPTFVETNMTRKRLQTEEFRRYVLGKIPAHVLATVEDIAAAAVFLASDEARMVNAHTLSVDGGWTAW